MTSKSSFSVNIITMGCSKNLIDSERILRRLHDAGINAVHNGDDFTGDAVIINTCGFIGDAKEESIDVILQAVQAKEAGGIGSIYVMGCLSERYRNDLPAEIPEVDGWYGKYDWDGIIEMIIRKADAKQPGCKNWDRIITTPSHHAYLKIAEGCNRFCAFCAIPIITGRYHSRPVDEILDEVNELVSRGVKEFNVIAQDLSYYGKDLYGKSALAGLLEKMALTKGVERIRLHYAYPTDFPYDILPIMARYDNICKYLDIALQHIDDTVLSNMQRHITGKQTIELLERIRREVPGIHIRTTLMVGFPGETDQAFERLVEFVKDMRFERMGAFAYCEEEDTAAARNFEDSIPEEIKQERLDRIMAIQQDISLEINESKIGQVLPVIIDSETDEYYIGRTEFDSPEVDPEVLVDKSASLEIGSIYNIRITKAYPFELYGEIAK